MLAQLAGGYAVDALEMPIKVTLIGETYLAGNLAERKSALVDQIVRPLDSQPDHMLPERQPGGNLELPPQVRAADVQKLGQLLGGMQIAKMFVDVAVYLGALLRRQTSSWNVINGLAVGVVAQQMEHQRLSDRLDKQLS